MALLNGKPINNAKGLVAFHTEDYEKALKAAYDRGYAQGVKDAQKTNTTTGKTKSKIKHNNTELEFRATESEE